MPKVAYSQADRARIRAHLIQAGLELMARQGIQHTTVEQIYTAAGISRTFFYTFFPAKEDLILEALYLQQPKIIAYARGLMDNPALTWREGVEKFLHALCYGQGCGIAVLTMEEQQVLFRRFSPESLELFRRRQVALIRQVLEVFGVEADESRAKVLLNLFLSVAIVCRAVPKGLPLFAPEAMDQTVAIQIGALIDHLEGLKSPG